jgi:hypothetical protein
LIFAREGRQPQQLKLVALLSRKTEKPTFQTKLRSLTVFAHYSASIPSKHQNNEKKINEIDENLLLLLLPTLL